MEKLNLTQEWDKVFPKSDKVDHKKVTFHNRYGITLAADMYTPKGTEGKLPAIAVSGPFGAVKEQSSGLYAQKMAELGFLTIAFDPSYTGESGGTPRYVASPDINTEDFCAAVDFLSVDVIKVKTLHSDSAVTRELVLIKVSCTPKQRPEIISIADIAKGKISDISTNSMTIELSDTKQNLDTYEELLRPYGIKEVVRTGTIAMQKGEAAVRV